MATKKRKTPVKQTEKSVKRTAKATKKSGVSKWIWIGVAAIGAIVLYSSFSGGSKMTLEKCKADPACVRKYWAWRINVDPDWKAAVQSKATTNGISYEAQLEKDITWMIDQGNTIDFQYESFASNL